MGVSLFPLLRRKGRQMSKPQFPQGPFVSEGTVGDFYLARTVIRNHIVFSVVENGKQPWEGTIFPRLQLARDYLKANGFRLKGKSNDLEVV